MKRYTKESIEAMLDAFASAHGRAPTLEEIQSGGEWPVYQTIKRQLGMTPQAYYKSKYGAKKKLSKKKKAKRPRQYTPELVEQLMTQFVEKNGRVPSMKDMNSKCGLPNYTPFKKATGMTLKEYLNAHPELNLDQDTGESKNEIAESVPTTTLEVSSTVPAISEYMARMGMSLEELAFQTRIPVDRLSELLTESAADLYKELYAIARALRVPMEILYK